MWALYSLPFVSENTWCSHFFCAVSVLGLLLFLSQALAAELEGWAIEGSKWKKRYKTEKGTYMEMHLGEVGGVGSNLETCRIWKDRKMEDISGWRAEWGLGRRLSWKMPTMQAWGREFGHQNPHFWKLQVWWCFLVISVLEPELGRTQGLAWQVSTGCLVSSRPVVLWAPGMSCGMCVPTDTHLHTMYTHSHNRKDQTLSLSFVPTFSPELEPPVFVPYCQDGRRMGGPCSENL